MEDFLQLVLNGPMTVVIPFLITAGLVWVLYYFVFPIVDRNEKLIEENKKLQDALTTEVVTINKSLATLDTSKVLNELEEDISNLVKDYPKIEGELHNVSNKILEIRELLTSSRRNIDNTAQIIGIMKSIEALERSIEIIKERQITQAGVLSNISSNLSHPVNSMLNK